MRASSTALVATYGARLIQRWYRDLVWRGHGDEPTLYLTFDDGPSPSLSDRLLSILDRFEAKATFFLIGEHAARDPDWVQRAAAQGHSIGNHTQTHADLWQTSAEATLRELETATQVLHDLVESPIRWVRPPYGRVSDTLRAWSRHRRQRIAMWDVMPADFMTGTTQGQLERRLLRQVRPGSVVVLHDHPVAAEKTPAALETLLHTFSDRGWRFRALPG